MSHRAFAFGIAAFLLAAIILGLLTVGGPGSAKRDRYDQLRYEDLRFLETALRCTNWRILEPELPDDLTLDSLRSYCGGVEVELAGLVDDETGEPYRYTKISEKEFSVCADFYDAHNTINTITKSRSDFGASSSFNPDTGCVSGRVR